VSKAALNEMSRLQKIEEQFPIKIEQYLQTEVTLAMFIVKKPF